ncbi:cytochrome P450 [Mucidula mucida]|nr:cytochrome P450 [Mucidula mucida]
MFVQHLETLHEVYGPVVRIRPNELHFNTLKRSLRSTLPTPDSRRIRSLYLFWRGRCLLRDDERPGSQDTARDSQSSFSRRAILKLEIFVHEKVDLFVEQISKYKAHPLTSSAVPLPCYGHRHRLQLRALLWGAHHPEFDHPILRAVEGAIPIMTATKFFPILHALHHIPDWLGVALNPEMGGVAQLRAFLGAQVDAILRDSESLRSVEHETIYHHLITPELVKKGEVPSRKALIEEAMVLLIAGTDTSSNAMTIGFFHLMANEGLKKKLQAELREAWPEKDTPFSYEMAEKLPYLTAVIKEALRLSAGVPVSLPRVVESATIIDGHAVPAGSIVGVSQPFVLKNPNIFPDPLEFRPERWIGADAQKLDKYLIVFSKGPRSCLGMNLGWCELYLAFAHLMRKFDMQLFETSLEDMVFRDHAVPVWTTRPLQAIVTEQVE